MDCSFGKASAAVCVKSRAARIADWASDAGNAGLGEDRAARTERPTPELRERAAALLLNERAALVFLELLERIVAPEASTPW
mgnify:CR=1 FL=1